MRTVIYYTTKGTKTASYAEAKKIGIKRTDLVDITEPMAKPTKRAEAAKNLKKAWHFVKPLL